MLHYLLIFIFIANATYFLITGISSFFETRPTLHVHFPSGIKLFSSARVFSIFKTASSFINKPFFNLPYLKTLQKQADSLRMPLGAIELLLIKELVMVGAGVLVSVFSSPLYVLPAAVLGFFIPDFFLSQKIKARKEDIARIFPETVDLLDLCISGGLDFASSMRWVIEKSYANPCIEEFKLVLHEIQMGSSRKDALREMAKRLQIPDINSFSRTIIQAERMGTSIEEALKILSEDTRETRFQKGERYAIKASLKILFPLIFFILPVILIVVAGPIIIQFHEGGLIPAGGGF